MAPGVILWTLAVVSVLWRLELQTPAEASRRAPGAVSDPPLSPVRRGHVPSREVEEQQLRASVLVVEQAFRTLVVLWGDLWISGSRCARGLHAPRPDAASDDGHAGRALDGVRRRADSVAPRRRVSWRPQRI